MKDVARTRNSVCHPDPSLASEIADFFAEFGCDDGSEHIDSHGKRDLEITRSVAEVENADATDDALKLVERAPDAAKAPETIARIFAEAPKDEVQPAVAAGAPKAVKFHYLTTFKHDLETMLTNSVDRTTWTEANNSLNASLFL